MNLRFCFSYVLRCSGSSSRVHVTPLKVRCPRSAGDNSLHRTERKLGPRGWTADNEKKFSGGRERKCGRWHCLTSSESADWRARISYAGGPDKKKNLTKIRRLFLRVTELFSSGPPLQDWRTGLSPCSGERRALPEKQSAFFFPLYESNVRQRERRQPWT